MTATLTVIILILLVVIMLLAEKLRRKSSDYKWVESLFRAQKDVIKRDTERMLQLRNDSEERHRIDTAQIRDLKALIATYRERV